MLQFFWSKIYAGPHTELPYSSVGCTNVVNNTIEVENAIAMCSSTASTCI